MSRVGPPRGADAALARRKAAVVVATQGEERPQQLTLFGNAATVPTLELQ